jgi:hypothetical protein
MRLTQLFMRLYHSILSSWPEADVTDLLTSVALIVSINTSNHVFGAATALRRWHPVDGCQDFLINALGA